jgi:ankyrin repeat protein
LFCFSSLNYEGYSPLHLAVLAQSTDLVRELLYMKHLKINTQDKRAGMTALHYAAGIYNQLKICKLLVLNEQIECNCRAFNGCTPLHVAVANRNYLIVCLLLNCGGDIHLYSDMSIYYGNDSYFMNLATQKLNNMRRHVEMIINNSLDSLNGESVHESVSNMKNLKNPFFAYNDQKLSEEVEKDCDEFSMNHCGGIEGITDLNQQTNQFNAIYYARNDPWVSVLLFLI